MKASKIDYDGLFDLHNGFHALFVAAGARPRLRNLLDSVRPQVDRYEWVYAPLVGPDYEETFVEHRRIVDAIREGSGNAARKAVVENWERGAERLRAVIEAVGERGDWSHAQTQVRPQRSAPRSAFRAIPKRLPNS